MAVRFCPRALKDPRIHVAKVLLKSLVSPWEFLLACTCRLREDHVSRWQSHELKLGYAPSTLAKYLYGLSFAELEEFSTDILRRYVLQLPGANLKSITKERLAQWRMRSTAAGEAAGNG